MVVRTEVQGSAEKRVINTGQGRLHSERVEAESAGRQRERERHSRYRE